MAAMTLLEIVNSTLCDMDSDEINSINDTIEAGQVANIAKDTFFFLMSKRDWPHLKTLATLDAVSDVTRPTYLSMPTDTFQLDWFAYNKRDDCDIEDKYKEVCYMEPDVFLSRQNSLQESSTIVDQITDFSGVKFNIYNDRAPSYWTSFDDEYIICDSFDKIMDTTLQSSKTQARVIREPVWSTSDSAIPDLPNEMFPTYLAEVKSTAFLALKEMVNEKEESKSQRGQRRLSRKSWKTHGGIRIPSYGRRGRGKNPYFQKT